MTEPVHKAYFEALKIIVERDKEIEKLKQENEESWRLLCREVGLSEDDPEPFVHVIMLVDSLKAEIKRLNAQRIEIAKNA